jgi:hypothetical protein
MHASALRDEHMCEAFAACRQLPKFKQGGTARSCARGVTARSRECVLSDVAVYVLWSSFLSRIAVMCAVYWHALQI